MSPGKVMRPFRFELSWLENESCGRVVDRVWSRAGQTSPMHDFTHKICLLQGDLRRWAKHEVGNVERRFQSTCKDIVEMEERDSRGLLNEEALPSLRSLYNRKAALSRQLNLRWMQRARQRWVKDGDHNTKYFQLLATIRRQRNQISGVFDSTGTWVQEQEEVERQFSAFYKELWGVVADSTHPMVPWPELPFLSAEEAQRLEAPVSREEIKAALWSLPRGKTPGPDGLQAEVYIHFWDAMGESLIQAIQRFFNAAALPRRLKPLLPKLVGTEQAAFVAGRNIVDNTLAAQEVAHSMCSDKRSPPVMMAKLDMEKAYDRVKWEAVMETMARMGFPAAWRRWIWACISSPSYAILINGKQSEWIHPHRGLRQGDPLSPYLFILVSQILSGLINQKVSSGELKAFRVGDVRISHLLYADDPLITVCATPSNADRILECLSNYETLSNQRVNFQKSALYLPTWLQATQRHELSGKLGLLCASLPFLYLGVLISGNRVKVREHQFLIERVDRKLANWKKGVLSMAGRCTLINATLLAIPTYWLGSIWLPDSVLDSITKRARSFLWDKANGRGMHLVSWETVSKPKEEGGLAIRDLRKARTAHLGKLALKVLNQEEVPWIRLLTAKYGQLRPWNRFEGRQVSWLWRALNGVARSLKMGFRKLIGNGCTTSAATEPWISVVPWNRQPRIMGTSLLDERLRVEEILDRQRWSNSRIVREAKEDLAFDILSFQAGSHNSEDKWIWWPHPMGTPTVKSIYSFISPAVVDAWPGWKAIWKLQVAPRVRTFVWKLSWRRLPTNSMLEALGLGYEAVCGLCRVHNETINHLFFTCRYSRECWEEFQGCVGGREVQVDENWMNSTWQADRQKDMEDKAKVATALWMIWKQRNVVTFGGEKLSPRVVIRKALAMASEYAKTGKASKEVTARGSAKWKAPDKGWVKLNIDGSYDPSKPQGGVGMVLRDEVGKLLQLAWEPCPSIAAIYAEAWAARFGLRMVDKDCQLILETDSGELARCLRGESSPPWCIRNMVDECKTLLSKCRGWSVSCVYREANRAADWAAKRGKMVGATAWLEMGETVPLDLCILLCTDSQEAIGPMDAFTHKVKVMLKGIVGVEQKLCWVGEKEDEGDAMGS
ncbi:uncharacterized protein [Typha latifolia]|uniref:uncharacterized protein n=1 Tax=Typha latifolia TaxID=4733 RepID=UPI003C2D866E